MNLNKILLTATVAFTLESIASDVNSPTNLILPKKNLPSSTFNLPAWPYSDEMIKSITQNNALDNIETPNLDILRKKLGSFIKTGENLQNALEELINFTEKYETSVKENGSSAATLDLYRKACKVELLYRNTIYMTSWNGLPFDLKAVVESALLLASKKIEPVYQRMKDDYDVSHARNYALLRYHETKDGFIIEHGKWQKIPVNQQNRYLLR
jgi:hypothetical protein